MSNCLLYMSCLHVSKIYHQPWSKKPLFPVNNREWNNVWLHKILRIVMDKFSALSKTFRPSPLSFKKYCRRGNERMLEIEDMRKGYKMSFFRQNTANAFINSQYLQIHVLGRQKNGPLVIRHRQRRNSGDFTLIDKLLATDRLKEHRNYHLYLY